MDLAWGLNSIIHSSHFLRELPSDSAMFTLRWCAGFEEQWARSVEPDIVRMTDSRDS